MGNLSAKEQGKYMTICLRNGIRLFPVPYGNRYKIVVERHGKAKKGEETYPLKSDKTAIGVYDKIYQLYQQIADNITKPKSATTIN